MKPFEKYKLIHYFMYPNDPLKEWINKDTYTDVFADDWNTLMDVIEKVESVELEDDNCLAIVIYSRGPVRVFDINNSFIDKTIEVHSTKIMNVYHAVVEAIQFLKSRSLK